MNADQRLLLLGVSSDIALYLANRFLDRGTEVYGTFRQRCDMVTDIQNRGAKLSQVDLLSDPDLRTFARKYEGSRAPWNTLISAVGQLTPIGRFFSLDFDAWADSVTVNSLAQLRAIHLLYPLRDQRAPAKVILFAGGGTNSPFDAYSAYCVGKLVLIKMCELLYSEYPDLHISILGTGWVETKIHRQTMAAGAAAGDNLDRTQAFLEQEHSAGTSLADVGDCVDWCLAAPPDAVAGRNFSVVHDPWRDPSFILALQQDAGLCKLRRHQG